MTIDIGQFLPIFFEETREHLEAMESGLLALDLAEPDEELVNAVFRAAHSIKGGSGTFGFADVAGFTHTLETLLDRVRHGDLQLDDKAVDVCLAAVDVLRAMVAAHQGGPAADPVQVAQVSAALTLRASLPGAAEPVQAASGVPAASDQERLVRITWRLPAAYPVPEGAIGHLIDTLAQLGRIEGLAQPSEPGAGGEWMIELATCAGVEELRELVGFVLEPGFVEVCLLAGEEDCKPVPYGFFDNAPGLDAVQAAVSVDPGYGFFDPLPVAVAGPLSQDEGYGFFDPLPGCADAPHEGGIPPATTNAPPEPADAGFGFFDDAPGLPAPDTGRADGSPVSGAGEGYGFFDGAPGLTPAPVTPAPPDASPAPPPPAAAERGSRSGTAAVPHGDTSIRVGTTKVDQLINLVGELVITQSMLRQSARELDPVEHERMIAGLAQLERNSRDLQEAVMSIRMVPMSLVFSRFPRMVRDLAKKLGKHAELHLVGESTELDKGLTEKIVDPLTHLVRNAVDHGLETTEARLAAGKPETGHITLAASHQSGHIVIEISDDGAGLNRERILAKARENGLPVPGEMSDADVWDLIFAPGFSTAEAITDVSGRGVGMDVVRKNIQALGGTVQLSSAPGRGTRVSIRLPLTLAILDGMSVRVGSETFIVPLGFVVESLQAEGLALRSVGRDGRVVKVREEYLPVVGLADLFGIEGDRAHGRVLVVLEAENRKLALGVDELLGQHQVVVKNLETNYRRVSGVSGATILGDGKVSLILDVNGIIQMAAQAEVFQ